MRRRGRDDDSEGCCQQYVLSAHKPAFDIGTLRFAGQFDPAHFLQINLTQINASGPNPPDLVELL
jgi:hypothetical protein